MDRLHLGWERPIGQYVRRVPHLILETDMSTGGRSLNQGGLGGTIRQFTAMWRLSNSDLSVAGLNPDALRLQGAEFADDESHMHVNIGEFIATIINVWLALVPSLSRDEPSPTLVAHVLRWNSDAVRRHVRDSRSTADPFFQLVVTAHELESAQASQAATFHD